jgi:hypothetical protein
LENCTYKKVSAKGKDRGRRPFDGS